ncbi:MAG: HD domain-containing protein [Lachnospiraceae bacterium]|nr:HD domain-containing protein [Lachnospiraceae bacterium]
MERVNLILEDYEYREHCKRIKKLEKDRIFCKHDMVHFLNVARIAMILNLQEELSIPQEVIYAAGLLHDVGRDVQYLEKIPHEIASSKIAPDILKRTGFSDNEIIQIIDAIRNHRTEEIAKEKNLSGILYRADKLSRECFWCESEKLCDWKDGKKNRKVVY